MSREDLVHRFDVSLATDLNLGNSPKSVIPQMGYEISNHEDLSKQLFTPRGDQQDFDPERPVDDR
ncbi:MAG: hypothetical protein AAFY29_04095 [Pseudomonadota bacterium]